MAGEDVPAPAVAGEQLGLDSLKPGSYVSQGEMINDLTPTKPLTLLRAFFVDRIHPTTIDPFDPINYPKRMGDFVGKNTRNPGGAERNTGEGLLSCEYGTHKPVKARFLPWLSG